jgi:hypothetical protein
MAETSKKAHFNDAAGHSISGLPFHVNSVKEGLLNFTSFIRTQAAEALFGGTSSSGSRAQGFIPHSAYKLEDGDNRTDWRNIRFLQNAKYMTSRAEELEKEPNNIYAWEIFFRRTIIDILNDVQDFQYVELHRSFWENTLLISHTPKISFAPTDFMVRSHLHCLHSSY